MRIGLAYNEKPDPASAEEPPSNTDAFAEWDDPSTIAAVEQALGLFGPVIRLEADQFFPQKLALARPDLVFNMAEGLHGQNREALVPAICEYLNIPYTGSDPLTLGLSLHKARTKELLAYRGVPTAPFACVATPAELDGVALPFPVFVKPVAEGSSKGVFVNNLCHTPEELRERVLFLLERYAEPVLVETYLPGPEFTVAILGNGAEASCLPVIGLDFSALPVGPPRRSAPHLPVSRPRARAAVPRDRAHRARRLPRARLPRLVPRGPAGGPLRRAQCAGAEPAAGDHPRSGDELVFPQGGAGGGLHLRRADPRGRAHRLAAAHGTRACDPPRGRGAGARGDPGVRIVILYDPGAGDWTPEDIRGVLKAVDEVGAVFATMGHEVRKVPVRHDMRWFHTARRADLVFNLCEGVHGKGEWEEHVVGTLEFAGVPVTGASLWTLAACRRKPVANALLAQAGLPVPRWVVAQGRIDDDFPLPAIVKPAAEDASAGLDRGSVASDRKALRARVAAMTEQFDEVLVQEYIPGREFNVGFVGTRALPVAEIDFSRMPEGAWPILTYAGKWEVGSPDDLGSVPVCPAAIPQKLAATLVRVAETAWRTMQGKGYGRVDLRVDEQGRPWVLEVNPNPDLNDDAGLSRMARAAGWDYAELVRAIAELALREAQGAKAACELLGPSRRPRATRTA